MIPSPRLSDTAIAAIRTFVPLVVGSLISWLLTMNVVLDAATEASLTTALTAIVTAVYWSVVTWASKKLPILGWLLGYPSTPTYEATETSTTSADPIVEDLGSPELDDGNGTIFRAED